jgi:trimethylamine--corrinoid protein Co-methyltransferase
MGAVLAALGGGDICGLLGLIDSAMTLYPEQVILDHEICQMAFDLLGGFEFDAADIALDVIKDVGPRGHFLAPRHTRKRIRDFRLSPLLRQKGPNGGERDPREVALEEFKLLDETHRPEPLPRHVLAELDHILAAADREAKKIGRKE